MIVEIKLDFCALILAFGIIAIGSVWKTQDLNVTEIFKQ